MKKVRVCTVAVCAFLLVSLLGGAIYDRGVYQFLGVNNEMLMGESVDDAAAFVVEDGVNKGAFTERRLSLKKGAYNLIVRYHATQPGSTISVENRQIVNADNTVGLVYASAELTPGQQETALQFTLSESLSIVTVATSFSGKGTLSLLNFYLKPAFFPYYWDSVLTALLAAALFAWLYWLVLAKPLAINETLQARLRGLAPVFVLLVLAFFVNYPLFQRDLLAGLDQYFHLFRIKGLAEGLASGQFPVRINPALGSGTGYALGIMYPDFFLWPFALLYLAGVSLPMSYQLLLIATNLGTILIAYWVGGRLFPRPWASLCFTIIYTLAPYRVNNMYARQAIGESLAMLFFPLVLLGFYEIFAGDAKKWSCLALGVIGITLSHVLSIYMLAFFCVILALIFIKRLLAQKQRILALLKAFAVTVLSCLWWLVPFVHYNLSGLNIQSIYYDSEFRALGISQLFRQYFVEYYLSFGLPMLLCGLAAVILLLFFHRQTGAALVRQCAFYLAMGCFCLWMCTKLFPWELLDHLPVLSSMSNILQFPWRFYAPATLFFALCGVLVFVALKNRKQKLVVLGLVTALFFFPAYTIMEGQQSLPKGATRESLMDEHPLNLQRAEYYMAGIESEPILAHDGTVQSGAQNLAISNWRKNGLTMSFDYKINKMKDGAWLDIPVVWYPGYSAKDGDGRAVATSRGDDGWVRVTAPSAEGSLTVWYAGMWWYRIGDCVSLAFVLGMGVYWLWRRRRTYALTAVAQ